MRILLLVHGFNSLSQRLFVELSEAGHDVSIEFDINDEVLAEAVDLFRPDVIVAPFLKRAIPETIWRNHLCLIVHPGPVGDRGPSSVDWAILDGVDSWGVTVLQAEAEMDAGPVWASATFPMRPATKSSIYRNEVTDAASLAVAEALERIQSGVYVPARESGVARAAVKQADRAIDWSRDDTQSVLRKIRGADGVPGVKDWMAGRQVYVHDVRMAEGMTGEPGSLIAKSGPAICRASVDGAVWIGHLRDPESATPFKLPAVRVLADESADLPDVPVDQDNGYQEIRYVQDGAVGYLHFDFYNGAMGTERCQRLLAAYREALVRPTKVIVLMGGPDFWSNGMDLNALEAASSAADASWENINAIDDLAEAIVRTDSHMTVAALQGNAGAGGVFLARAADRVWLRNGIVLNPHYKDMGNLYGSELWTYLLPKHAGSENAKRITEARLPMSVHEAARLGLADAVLDGDRSAFLQEVAAQARSLAGDGISSLLAEKKTVRAEDEAEKPLSAYRAEELARMRRNFFGFDPSYHVARYNFVCKIPKSRTPVTLAHHRDRRQGLAAKGDPMREAS